MSAMGDSYPKRGDYEYIKKKAEDVFYDPAVATPELIDEVYASINDRRKLIKTLTIAKSAFVNKRPSENACANVYYLG
jgi:hypothetical protein